MENLEKPMVSATQEPQTEIRFEAQDLYAHGLEQAGRGEVLHVSVALGDDEHIFVLTCKTL